VGCGGGGADMRHYCIIALLHLSSCPSSLRSSGRWAWGDSLLLLVTRGVKSFWLAIHSNQANLIVGGLQHRRHQQGTPTGRTCDTCTCNSSICSCCCGWCTPSCHSSQRSSGRWAVVRGGGGPHPPGAHCMTCYTQPGVVTYVSRYGRQQIPLGVSWPLHLLFAGQLGFVSSC
jgi:hypothetical protein